MKARVMLATMWISAFVVGSLNAQSKKIQTLQFGCRYYGGNIDHSHICDMSGYISNNKHAENVVDRILKPVGLNRNFVVMECPNIDNCFATTVTGVRYVVYDKEFFRRVENEAQTDWAAISILAHEVGHHLQGHTIDGKGSRPDKELEADKFSGFVLHQMGASLEEAQIAMKLFQDDLGNSTHPAKILRLQAIEKGWKDAEDIYPERNKAKRENEAHKTVRQEIPQEKVIVVTPKIKQQEGMVIEVERQPQTNVDNVERKVKVAGESEGVGCIVGNCNNGRGIFIHEKGEKYDGEWRSGLRNGWGLNYYPNGDTKYEGNFLNDKRNGEGTYYFRNGDRYEGTFVENRMHGRGIYYYANGDKFVGNFSNDQREGQGKYIYDDGRVEINQYRKDTKQ
jgi:hypothetical protein